MTDPKAICFYAWLQCDDEQYLKEWAEQTAVAVERVVEEMCKISEGKVTKAAMESSVAHPVRDEAPKNREDV